MTKRLFACIFAAGLALAAFHSVAAADKTPRGAVWIAEWDFDDGVEDLRAMGDALSSVQIFGAVFARDDRPFVKEALQRRLRDNAGFFAGRDLYLTVVNDAEKEDGTTTLKDPDLITRLMASPESRERHRRDLLALLAGGPYVGLDIDYEQVKADDWPVLLDFCADLSRELAASGRRVRVVVEPKAMYYKTRYPPGPEYVVMAYNLFGGHSGPGPKANPSFLARLAAQMRSTGATARLALSTGGFDWPAEGRVASLTEKKAMELAAKHDVAVSRDVDSRYLHFGYRDENDKERTVWYADAHALRNLLETGRRMGFEKFDIWRVGGLSPETIAMFARESVPPPAGAARVLRVGPGRDFSGITDAVRVAKPGDCIEVAAGEYREAIRVTTPGLTIVAEGFSGGGGEAAPVRIVAPEGEAALYDSQNTVWRGIAFAGDGDAVVELEFFEGRFEQCGFFSGSGDEASAALVIYEGNASFHGCVVKGRAGYGAVMSSFPGRAGQAAATVDFTYCLIEGFRTSALHARDKVAARLANCVLTRNGLILQRFSGSVGKVDVVNSILYYNTGRMLVNTSASPEPLRVENCFVSPIFNSQIWVVGLSIYEQPGVEAVNCRIISPRFVRSGRPALVNLGIDDTINLGVFDDMVQAVGKYGYPLTWAINTDAAQENDWRKAVEFIGKGHEIASHSASHVGVEIDIPMSLGRGGDDVDSAFISIDAKKGVVLTVNDKVIGSFSVDDGKMTLVSLGNRLRRYGFTCHVSHIYGNITVNEIEPVENLDVAFPEPSVPLYLRSDKLFENQMDKSYQALRGNLPPETDIPFINPFVVTSPLTRRRLAAIGYSCARALLPNDYEEDEQGRADGRVIYNSFAIPCVAFNSCRYTEEGDDAQLESLLLALDYVKEGMGAISFYSHTYNELTLEQWEAVWGLLSKDPNVRVVTLTDMTREMTARGEALGDDFYLTPLDDYNTDYRLRDDSPGLGAGKSLGLPYDFVGTPVPSDKPPNIGLFQ